MWISTKNVWERRSFKLWNENARQQDLMQNANATKELGTIRKKKLRMHIKPLHKKTTKKTQKKKSQ